MQFNIFNKSISELRTEVLILPAFEGKSLSSLIKSVDKQLGGVIQNAVRLQDFKGEPGEIVNFYSQNKIKAQRIKLLGLGPKKDFNLEILKSAIAEGIKAVEKLKIKDAALALDDLSSKQFGIKDISQALVQSVLLTTYRFEFHKRHLLKDKKYQPLKLKEVNYWTEKSLNNKNIESGIATGEVIAQAQNWCRDLINHPGNYFTPGKFAETAESLASANKIKITVWGESDMKKKNMGAILAVSRGSDEEAKFIMLDYGPRSQRPIVLIGKGVTFDSGGINLKPGEGMAEMKMDMSGGAAVLAAAKAISDLKIKKRVVFLIPAVENLPSGKAIKPGDVIQTHSGKTVEILNTDAEGRLILADALSFASSLKPKAVVDLATLTGAIMVSLGIGVGKPAGLFSNDERLLKQVQQAAEAAHEKVWPMPGSPGFHASPDWRTYDEELKSEMADIKNVGPRWGGAITAALFLENFTREFKWVHLDIAGVAWTEKPKSYFPAGATGWGVATLVELVKRL